MLSEMRLLILLLALQSPSTAVRATAADTAIARATLLTGLIEFEQSNVDIPRSEFGILFLDQLRLWGLKEEGGNAALRFDTAVMRKYRGVSTHNSYWWFSSLFQRGDSVEAFRFIARLSPDSRDDILWLVAKDLTSFGRPELVAQLEARMTMPWPRAELLHHRSLYAGSRSDTAAARALLTEAIELSRAGGRPSWTWMIELLRLDGQVRVEDIVQVAASQDGDLWNARYSVVETMIRNGLRPLTTALVDSLTAGIERQPPDRQPYSRMRMLNLSGTESDRLLAQLLRDSVDLARNIDPGAVERRRSMATQSSLYRSASQHNVVLLREVFSGVISDTVLADFLKRVQAATMQSVAELRPSARFDDGMGRYRDSLRSYARVVLDLTAPRLLERPAQFRDSAQVFRVAIASYLNASEGLALARSIPTPRFRDRAVTEAIKQLVRIDAEAAEREASSLRDSSARANAYGALAQAAVAGGRLAAAASLASKATGEPHLRAVFEISAAQYKGGRLNDAQRTIARMLELVDAEVGCQGCINVTTRTAPPAKPGTNPQLLAEVVFLAMQVGMREDLLRWASSQTGSSRRANAHLMVVEAMSRQLLGQSPRQRLN